MHGRTDDGWSTPEMQQAERELDARIDYAMSVATEVREKADELERWVEAQEPPSDEDVERIKNFVLGHARTDEWQRVIDRIDRGELTWRQVVEGLASGTLDHRVAAAFESLSRVPPANLEKLIEIGVFPAQLPDEAPTDDKANDESAPRRGGADHPSAGGQDDEEWYDEDPLRRRR